MSLSRWKGRRRQGFYANMIASKTNQFQVVTERIFVDDGGVITEGQVKQVYSGPMVTAMGITELDGSPIAEGDLILTTTQLLTVWPAGKGQSWWAKTSTSATTRF